MKTAVFELGKQSLAEWVEQNRDCEKMVLVGNVYCNLWDDNFQYKVKGEKGIYGYRREINIGWHSYDLLFGFERMAKDFHPAEFDITNMHLLDYKGNINDEGIPDDADEEQPSLILKMLVNRKYGTRFVYKDGILTTPDGKVLVHQPDAEHIVVPEGIETIGRLAFASYEKMKRIELPAGLKEFGDVSFEFVDNLEELTMPDTVEKLGENSFCYADIGIIRVSDKIEVFPPYCFRYCAIDHLPSSLKTIENDNCFHFAEDSDGIIEFPYGFEHLGSYSVGAFEEVRFPATTKYIADDFWYDYIVGPDDSRKPVIVIASDNPYFAVEGVNNIVRKCVTDIETQRTFSRRAIGFVESETERNYLLEKDVLLSPKEIINLVEMSPERKGSHKKWFYWDLAQTTILTEQERLLLSYVTEKVEKMWEELQGNYKVRKIAAFGVCYDYMDPKSGEYVGHKEFLLGEYPHSWACMDDMRKKKALEKYDKIVCRQYKTKDKALENEIGRFELDEDYCPINNDYYLWNRPVPKEISNLVDAYVDLPHPFEPGDIVKMPHYREQYVVAELFKPTKEQIESKYVDSSDMAVTVLPVECSETVRKCVNRGEKIPEELFSQHDHFSFLSLEMVEKFGL